MCGAKKFSKSEKASATPVHAPGAEKLVNISLGNYTQKWSLLEDQMIDH